ncbi:MAG: indole-3-glycerol phosphate synthase TrpC [Pseudomonadota bacterium]
MTILDDIIAYKRVEVAAAKANAPFSSVSALAQEIKPRGFRAALEKQSCKGFALIAEIKKASPSKGLIRANFDPADHARAYAEGGATCLSVLTDKPSFQGDPAYLRAARDAVSLPILRKDFIIDPYQIAEARAWGADCILLIVACLSDTLLKELSASASEQEMDVLVEVHDRQELERAVQVGSKFIGINNRNLKTFDTSLDVTRELAKYLPPDAFVVSESGISNHAHLAQLAAYGAKAFLVGESLMRQENVAEATRMLLRPTNLA